MAPEPNLLARPRIHLANVLATVGWIYMSLLAVVLMFKGLLNQPGIPWWLYAGTATSIALLLVGGGLAGGWKVVLLTSAMWLAVGAFADPITRALAWAFQNDQWILGLLLILAAGYAATFRVKFVPDDLGADESAI